MAIAEVQALATAPAPASPRDTISTHLPPSPPDSTTGDPPASTPPISKMTLVNGAPADTNGGATPASRSSSGSDGHAAQAKKGYIPKLEDFQLIRVLGKGCAGRVLLVKHTPSNGIHAMKAISKRSVLTHDELPHTLTENAILRRFATDEPHNRFVSRLHYSFTDKENFYFVMEFYPGGDLATQMEIYGILGDHRTRFYAADITQGLYDLHRHGIIVRDLKPENILLNDKGHAVLADFGLSKEFPYRGDPTPIHVVTYPGQGEPPEWAGAGAGSVRILPSGQKKLVVDKAYSFVGTSEYLSPEVVKRGDYSYAVDWWALGCIVLEGLIGRVPFRKAEDDPPMVLWNKILLDPWDDCFKDPKMARYAPDAVTYSFIDSLLQKDPLWRMTEPYVRYHEYFSMIDWDTVARGEYQDPHGLHLHPTAEYNTRYFPKLCLQESPSVDMSTHDLRDEPPHPGAELGGGKRTPLNDNALYALEQAKYRKELEGFTWVREGSGWGYGMGGDTETEGGSVGESAVEEGESIDAEGESEAEAAVSSEEEDASGDDVVMRELTTTPPLVDPNPLNAPEVKPVAPLADSPAAASLDQTPTATVPEPTPAAAPEETASTIEGLLAATKAQVAALKKKKLAAGEPSTAPAEPGPAVGAEIAEANAQEGAVEVAHAAEPAVEVKMGAEETEAEVGAVSGVEGGVLTDEPAEQIPGVVEGDAQSVPETGLAGQEPKAEGKNVVEEDVAMEAVPEEVPEVAVDGGGDVMMGEETKAVEDDDESASEQAGAVVAEEPMLAIPDAPAHASDSDPTPRPPPKPLPTPPTPKSLPAAPPSPPLPPLPASPEPCTDPAADASQEDVARSARGSALVRVPNTLADTPAPSQRFGVIRRHHRLPSDETSSLPIARLSVELHGTITQLSDEWEELEAGVGVPSAVNGPNGHGPGAGAGFFKGLSALRRKPSTLVGSSLRRQAQQTAGRESDGDSSRGSASPTKSSRSGERRLFDGVSGVGGKSMESTKKALGKLKAFPRLTGLAPERGGREKGSEARQGTGLVVGGGFTLPNPGVARFTPNSSPPPPTPLHPSDQPSTSGSATPHAARPHPQPGGPAPPVPHFPANQLAARPAAGRRHTESGWFERHRKKNKSASGSAFASAAGTSAGVGAGESMSTRASVAASVHGSAGSRAGSESEGAHAHGGGVSVVEGERGVPRLELRESGPLVWGF
ncbi:hypothetical protein IAT38_001467 [Cryptococcus sp. DSM 104549]